MDLTSCDRERAILVGPHEAPPLAGEEGLTLAHLILGSCCMAWPAIAMRHRSLLDLVATPHVVPGMEPSFADVRRMWRDIAEHYEYLAKHVPEHARHNWSSVQSV